MVGTETSHSHFKLLSTSPSGSSPNRWPTVGPVLSRAGVCVNLEMRERETERERERERDVVS